MVFSSSSFYLIIITPFHHITPYHITHLHIIKLTSSKYQHTLSRILNSYFYIGHPVKNNSTHFILYTMKLTFLSDAYIFFHYRQLFLF